jgi:hypothetical protein
MFPTKYLIRASKFNKALGERTYGHFDHDAWHSTGPGEQEPVSPEESGRTSRQDYNKPFVAKTCYEVIKDAVTGDSLMKPVRGTKSKSRM